MAKFDLKSYARAGAEARVRELQSELASIFRAFPDLRGDGGGGRKAGRKRKRKMSTAARKRISDAQKARWAKQKAGKPK